MPFGAGKLHSVVTAVLEAFRSDEDGGNVFWLAPDECLAEEAANELESVWYQLGLRDLTTYTLFGGTSFPLLDGLSNAIVIADIASFAGAIEKWREAETDVEQVFRDFGKKTRYVIFGDATQVQLASVRDILELMIPSSDAKLIGICAAPALAVEHNSVKALKEAFGGKIVEIDDDEPMAALQLAGETDPIEVFAISSPLTELEGGDDPIALPATSVALLAEHAERNKTLLNELLSLASVENRIVFYAATAMQARLVDFL